VEEKLSVGEFMGAVTEINKRGQECEHRISLKV
jgi:hypothetical protein